MGKYFTSVESTQIVDDKFFKRLDELKDKTKGVLFVGQNDGSPKVMYEGFCLKKFKGFAPLKPNTLGKDGSSVDNVNIPHKFNKKDMD